MSSIEWRKDSTEWIDDGSGYRWVRNSNTMYTAVVDGLAVTVGITPVMNNISVTMTVMVDEETIASITDPTEAFDIVLAKLSEVIAQ